MRSLRLRRFRSFTDTGRYELKPITVLVGSNSSGKSSYLRFFPLLRQTAETPTRSPLLWFGRYVDFGDFSKAAFRDTEPKSISFDIQTTVAAGRQRRRGERDDVPMTISVTLKADSTQGGAQTYVSRIEVRSWDDVCIVDFTEEDTVSQFLVNDINILPTFGKQGVQSIRAGFFPSLRYATDDNPHADFRITPLHTELASRFKPLAHNRTSAVKLLGYTRYLAFQDTQSMLKTIRGFSLRHYQNPSSDDYEFKRIRALAFAKDLTLLLARAQRAMASFASGINYLGPFRQNPERFYRQQELAVGQIEPHGENLAMFLRTLSASQLKELSDFVQAYLGVRVSVEDDGHHVSVFIEEGSDRRYNLIDMGYGLSQVLPVLALCWTTAYGVRISGREQSTSVLAIEQPELHLHPSHQARLADMFASVIELSRKRREQNPRRASKGQFSMWSDEEEYDFPLSLVIETHSEALVNRLGELIEAGTLKADDVSVLLFEKNSQTGCTDVRRSDFSENGTLQNWPLGFFAP